MSSREDFRVEASLANQIILIGKGTKVTAFDFCLVTRVPEVFMAIRSPAQIIYENEDDAPDEVAAAAQMDQSL